MIHTSFSRPPASTGQYPSVPKRSLPRWSLWAVALLGAMALVPRAAWAKKRKPPAAAPSASDMEARSKELLKKHFPLEEDIGPLPVVRVPKAEEGKKQMPPKPDKPRLEKARAETAQAAPPPGVAPPATAVPAAPPVEETSVAVAPPPKKEPVKAPPAAPAIGSEDSRQIDDLLSRALTDPGHHSAPDETAGDPVLPPLSMDAIKATMQAVQPEVKSQCRLGRLGVVLVRVVVAPSGEVARVTPEGKLAKAPPASCVAERVRRARFPRSAGGTFEYTLTVR
jgi:hypothetical protein